MDRPNLFNLLLAVILFTIVLTLVLYKILDAQDPQNKYSYMKPRYDSKTGAYKILKNSNTAILLKIAGLNPKQVYTRYLKVSFNTNN